MPGLQTACDVAALRRDLKRRRSAVPRRRRQQAGRRAWRHLEHWMPLRRARRVAVYLAMPDEFPTEPIIQGLLQQGKQVYVPVIDRRHPRQMVFQRYRPERRGWRRNRFGIVEPVARRSEQCAPAGLDLVLLPLLGFDSTGTRLGMGGGYYDTGFGFRLDRWRHRRPWLVGLAFDDQSCPVLERRSWDVPLDALVTESGVRVLV